MKGLVLETEEAQTTGSGSIHEIIEYCGAMKRIWSPSLALESTQVSTFPTEIPETKASGLMYSSQAEDWRYG